jgi:hypothetical protein
MAVSCLYFQLGKNLATGTLTLFSFGIIDFARFYAAAKLSVGGISSSTNFYEPVILTAEVKRLCFPFVPEGLFPIFYPPFFIAILQPLTIFGLIVAWRVWISIQFAIVFITCFVLSIKNGQFKWTRFVFVLIAFLACFPAFICLGLGQTSIVLLGACALFWYLLQNKQYVWAGLSLICCLLKLQYAPFLVIPGLILGRAKFLLGMMIALGLLSLISVIFIGDNSFQLYLNALLCYENDPSLADYAVNAMHNIRGLFFGQCGPNTSKIIATISLILSLVSIACLWLFIDSKNNPVIMRLLSAITILLMLLTSLHVYVFDYVLMLLPAIWLWDIYNDMPNNLFNKLNKFAIVLFPIVSWFFLLFSALEDLHPTFLLTLFITICAIIQLRQQMFSSKSN